MKRTMDDLTNCFNEASEANSNYVCVVVSMAGFPKEEVIINQRENFEAKLKYYQNVYDKGLDHKHATGVKIIGFSHGNTFNQIQKELAFKNLL